MSSSFLATSAIPENLHLATDASVHDLFRAFSTRSPNKRGIHHQVLHDDGQHVYWGRPFFKGFLFAEKRLVATLYKTPKPELERILPSYRDLWAHRLAHEAAQMIWAHETQQDAPAEPSWPTCSASLHAEDHGGYAIRVDARMDASAPAHTPDAGPTAPRGARTYTVVVSAHDLSATSLHEPTPARGTHSP